MIVSDATIWKSHVYTEVTMIVNLKRVGVFVSPLFPGLGGMRVNPLNNPMSMISDFGLLS